MDGIADMGGTQGWGTGPLRPRRRRSPFKEPWEGRAFAMILLPINRLSGRNLDAMRHALDRLRPVDYLATATTVAGCNCR